MTDQVSLRTGVPLADLTTMGVGGPAAGLLEVHSAGSLVSAVQDADAKGQPLLLLGGGSNVVISDAGFPGLVILIRTSGIKRDGISITAAAGQSWDELVTYAVENELAGIECLAGIPGLVGATPIQNVGAYGQDVAGVISRVTVYDRKHREIRRLTNRECLFGYRASRFKAEPARWVVTEVEFSLRGSAQSEASRGSAQSEASRGSAQSEASRGSAQSDPVRYGELSRALGVDPDSTAPLRAVSECVRRLRAGKGMVLDPADPDTASCGSFFTNPVLDAAGYAALRERVADEVPAFQEADGRFKVPAAWLIERSGFAKGYGAEVGSGRARLSTKHPLAVTNRGDASAAEIIAVARKVRDGVRDRLGVTLVNEPVLIGVAL